MASLGSIKANCLKAKKATFCQRYQQVMSFGLSCLECGVPVPVQLVCCDASRIILWECGMTILKSLSVGSAVLCLGISPIARQA